MLTARGWATLGAGLALALLWYLFGETEIGIAAVLAVAAALSALAFVTGRPPRLEIRRRISPTHVHDGDHASVRLTVVNRGRAVRHLTVSDDVVGLGTAEFATADLLPGKEASASYRVLCRPRGVYRVGPVRMRVADPLGLAARDMTSGRTDLLVVYPAVEDLVGLPGVPGRNLAVNAPRPQQNQRGGEDFYTLREYQRGDDLRRVHWPSTARRDQMMIRQLETPWQAQALVLLDTRVSSYPDAPAFERAVSGAASVVRHLLHNGVSTDVWTGESTAVGKGVRSGYAVAMERLAGVTVQPRADLSTLAPALRRRGGGGILVLVTGRADQSLMGLAHSLAPSYPTAVLLTAVDDTSAVRFGEGIVRVAPAAGEPWGPAWARGMRATWHAASVGS